MRHEQAIAAWLAKETRERTVLLLLGSLGQLLLGVFALFITFCVIYAVLWLGLGWLIPLSHTARVWISLAVLALLFVGNATTDRAYLESYSFTVGFGNDKPVTFSIPGMGSMVNPLAPDSAHSYVKMITNALYLGPRRVTDAICIFCRARQLRGIDREGCAAALVFLAEQDGRVPFQAVAAAIPRGHNVCAVLEQLHELHGVMFLKSEPPGVTLLSDFREELRNL
jgi:hypothetical protein